MEENLTARLCENSIFEGLTPEDVQKILPCIGYAVKSYGSQETIYSKGDKVQNLGVVLEGELTVCDENGEGRRTTIANIEKNGLFGEVVVFASSSALQHRVIADKGAQVLYLSGDFFLEPCDKHCNCRGIHQEVVKNMLRLLSDRAVLLNKKIAYLTANDLRMKIAMYLCDLYEACGSLSFNMPLNRDRLAEFFSVARPSLSREMVALKGQGVIDFYRSGVKILDTEALYRLARGE